MGAPQALALVVVQFLQLCVTAEASSQSLHQTSFLEAKAAYFFEEPWLFACSSRERKGYSSIYAPTREGFRFLPRIELAIANPTLTGKEVPTEYPAALEGGAFVRACPPNAVPPNVTSLFVTCGECDDFIEGKLTRLLEYKQEGAVTVLQSYCDGLEHIDMLYERMAEKCREYSGAVKATRKLSAIEDQKTLREFLQLEYGADCQDLWDGISKMQTLVANKLAERICLEHLPVDEQPDACLTQRM